MTLLLGLLCLVILLQFMRRPGGHVAFPAVFAVLYLGWVLPQVSGLAAIPGVPQDGWFALMLMAMLCLLAGWAGWSLTSTRRPKRLRKPPPLDHRKLILATGVLTVASLATNALLESMRPAMAGVQQWSGPITIVVFFAQIRNVALALSLLLVLQQRTKATLLLAVINLGTTLPVALIYLRRAEMIGLAIALVGAYWFARRKTPSLALVVPVIIGIAISVYSMGALRAASNEIEMATGQKVSLLSPDLWSKIDVGETIKSSAEQAPDFTNALYIIAYRQATLDLSLGATLWNGFVFQYVPGQIFGSEFKRSLLIGERGHVFQQIGGLFNYDYQVGTTATGFGSAFSDFWYFGALYFFVIAALLKRLYVRASAGDPWAQTLYLSLLPTSLIALTHGHEGFFVLMPFLYGVVVAIKRVAKPSAREARRQTPGEL